MLLISSSYQTLLSEAWFLKQQTKRCQDKNSNWATFKTLMTFHYTDWFMGILIVTVIIPYNPYNPWIVHTPLYYPANNNHWFWSLLNCFNNQMSGSESRGYFCASFSSRLGFVLFWRDLYYIYSMSWNIYVIYSYITYIYINSLHTQTKCVFSYCYKLHASCYNIYIYK